MKATALTSAGGLFVASIPNAEFWLKVIALLAPVVVGLVQAWRRPPPPPPPRPRRGPIILSALVCLSSLGVVGCASMQTAELVKALGNDTNSVTIDVQTTFGSVRVTRNAPK